MEKLNRQQQQAADFMYGVASVIAIPGSGKTTAMTHRIANLVRNGVAPENILGLTFTRNAAQQMREKLKPVLNATASKVNLSTIHSFCHRLLKDQDRVFEMIYGKRQIMLIHKVMKKQRLNDVLPAMALREISLAKSKLISCEEFSWLHEDNQTMLSVAEIYEGYEEEKSKRLLLDFDDLIIEVHKLLKAYDEIRYKYQQAFPHILVDEYQDTNPAQVQTLNLLLNGADQYGSFWICGDDWQSIYGFTGATIENILNFSSDHPDSKQFILDTNYRSTPQILEACRNLIRNNRTKIEKKLLSNNPDGDGVVVFGAIDEEDEVRKVVIEIKDLVNRHGYQYADIAVLYRANIQSRVVEEVLSKNEIPYKIENEANFYRRHDVVVLLNYLRLIQDPDSSRGDNALRKVINVPNRYIGHRFVNELEVHSQKKGVHLYEGLKSMPAVVPYLSKSIRAFTELIDSLIDTKADVEPVDLIYFLREHLDLDRHIADESQDLAGNSLDQLQMAAEKFTDVNAFLDYTELVRNSSSGMDNDGVRLMTVHKAKGLEFPVVFVIGLIDGVFPHANGEIEEERRIAFVGLSRAMKLLYLSYSDIYMGQPAKKSPFINEALEKEVVKEQ
jgi:DNA helicase-2/ATP-dependent DNA helicase PcrA